MTLEDARVLVTGGAGFIGSEVVKQLVDLGSFVTILDNFSSGKQEYIVKSDKVKVIQGDVCDETLIPEIVKDIEYIIHLAALPFIPDCYQHPQEFFKINTNGTLNLAYNSLKNESLERFVFISTSEVYGTAQYVPMDENHPTLPHSTYAVSKLAADRAIYTIHKEQGLPGVVIRPFNSFGPNITQPYIIPEIIMQLRNGAQKITLGNVESSRDFTFVSDTARGMILSLIKKEAIGETINLGSGMDIKIKDLAYLIAKVMGKEIEISIDKSRFRPFDVNRLYAGSQKAKDILGWEPKYSIEEGLRKTVEWSLDTSLRLKDPFKGWSKDETKVEYREQEEKS